MNIDELIFTFPNGAKVRLSEVISIGDIDKNFSTYNIYVPVVCRGFNKPIEFILGNGIGNLSQDTKFFIKETYIRFVSAWENYVLQSSMQP